MTSSKTELYYINITILVTQEMIKRYELKYNKEQNLYYVTNQTSPIFDQFKRIYIKL
jgi:hypothetical protein